MKTIEQLKLELKQARNLMYDLERQINAMPDGYTYHVCVRSYGSATWSRPVNTFVIQELADEYLDGYNGLVDVYTDNPDWRGESYGCLTVMPLEQLPESRREVSKSEGILNFMRLRGL